MITFDLETYKIERLCPRIVSICYAIDEEKPILLGRKDFHKFPDILKNAEPPIVVFAGEFDFGCLAAEFPDLVTWIFEAYAQGWVVDAKINAKLAAIEAGTHDRRRFNLASVVKSLLGVSISGKTGDDIWRLRYHELDGLDPATEWPEEAREYALNDVYWTRDVHRAQNYLRKHDQAQAAWALHLMSVYGMRINKSRAEKWLCDVAIEVEKGLEMAKGLGILRENGSRNVKALQALIWKAYDGSPPRTDSGKVSYSTDSLRESGDPDLIAYANCSFAVHTRQY